MQHLMQYLVFYLEAVVLHPIGADEVDAVWLKHSGSLHAHLRNVRCRPFSA